MYGREEVIVRGKTREALEELVAANNFNSHPRLQSISITQPELESKKPVGTGVPVKKDSATTDDEYKPVECAPEGVMLSVRWGVLPRVEYGMAKFAHGKWWNYSSSNTYANGRECVTPSGWRYMSASS
jgi:hypothetical protein